MSFQPHSNQCNSAAHHSQSGMVVILALFFVAIIAAMSYAMLSRLARDTYRTNMILNDIQLSYYAEGGVIWAFDLLFSDLQAKSPNKRVDAIPILSPVDRVGPYRIQTRLYDMQGRYNINRLVDANPEIGNELISLMQVLKVHLTADQMNQLVLAIGGWMSPGSGQTDLDRYYAARPVPYRAAHQVMKHISELRLVKGMTPTIYNIISPYLVALPDKTTPINVFTASIPVFTTLKLSLADATTLQQAVLMLQTSDPSRLKQLPTIQNHTIPLERLTVISDYFLAETTVSIESQQLVIYTLIERKQQTQGMAVLLKVIWQSKGIA